MVLFLVGFYFIFVSVCLSEALFFFFLSSRQEGAQDFDEAARCRRGWVHTPSSKQHSESGHCVVGTGVDQALLMQQPLPLEY